MLSRLKLYEEKNQKKKGSEYIKGYKFYEIKKIRQKNEINREFLVDF